MDIDFISFNETEVTAVTYQYREKPRLQAKLRIYFGAAPHTNFFVTDIVLTSINSLLTNLPVCLREEYSIKTELNDPSSKRREVPSPSILQKRSTITLTPPKGGTRLSCYGHQVQ